MRLILEAGHTMPSEHQLERWRGEGLLAPVRQVQIPYHGSRVEFPIGTAKQIIEIQRLLNIRKSLDFVGWELWWSGYPVDEKWWKPKLADAAKTIDKLSKRLKTLVRYEDIKSENINGNSPSIFDGKINLSTSGNIFSRILRRVNENEIGQLLNIFTQIGSGRFENFYNPNDDTIHSDEALLTRALDLNVSLLKHNNVDAYAGKHIIVGESLSLSESMPLTFRAMSRVFNSNRFTNALSFPQGEIETARNDYRNSLIIASNLYESTQWIFRERALGLRLLAWVASHSSVQTKVIGILIFIFLRRSGSYLMPSSVISATAESSIKMHSDAMEFRDILNANPALKKLSTPKVLRWALSSNSNLAEFETKLNAYFVSRKRI